MEIDQWRREYVQGGLQRSDLAESPVEQFEAWLGEVVKAGISDPSAMCLSTADASGQPSQRIVLLKGFDARGFVFYTNLKSQKAWDIAANPKVSLLFPWHFLDRQVIVRGVAEPLSDTEADEYFSSRPRDSQIAAWASHQSDAIVSRQVLEEGFETFRQKFDGQDVPRPEFWGGYRVEPHAVEFWQGRASRLHDRFVYRSMEGGDWQIERLSP
ncbi:pyridoxamine 5'-phosphate oxidase [Microbulbifer salipaludis]|uniref:Pyridoxine/pyridoxamine 5'-phosphate oxidase n=1 Tax=Microbulbifer salipaludis TaxID=187980 RepID=A0ABS3E6Z0_9GAMM|nr:pyridoxamine 5'-phosphate oxidase [Microbulbifer salipaludis]MBN8431088.1 pyridoxamine 5'-phosphate oxidase [Microbulbifer salipaludis]